MIGELAFAFTAGAVATVNPCGFALLPAYLARRLGANDEGRDRRDMAVARALFVGASTTLGFLLVFGACGAAVLLGAAWLAAAFPWAGLVIGVGLAAVGLLMLTAWHLRVPQFGSVGRSPGNGLRGDLAFGAAYGAASLSCTLPIFLAVAGLSTTLGVLGSALNLAAYALGIATVLTVVSVAAALSRRSLIAAVGSLRPYLSRVAGGLLFLAGAYVTYFWGTTLFPAGLAGADAVVAAGERVSGVLRGWLAAQTGQVALYALLALLGAIWSWVLWQWRREAARPAGIDARLQAPLGANHLGPEQTAVRLAGVAGGRRSKSKQGGRL